MKKITNLLLMNMILAVVFLFGTAAVNMDASEEFKAGAAPYCIDITQAESAEELKMLLLKPPCPIVCDWCGIAVFPDGTIGIQLGEPVTVS